MAKNLLNKYVWLVETIYKAKQISFEEINQQWYQEDYWTAMHAQADELDALIDDFNTKTGVLERM